MEPRPTPLVEDRDDVRWLAIAIRRACLLLASEIAKRYGLDGSRGVR